MGLTFTHGEARTDDDFLASRLRGKGYSVTAETVAADEAVPDTGEAAEAPNGDSSESELYEKTVQQLKEYAAEKGIDLSGARTKTEIISVISAFDTE